MEVYTTENEQVDVIRRFFSENGKALAVGVVLGIGALLGWRYWQSHQSTALAGASVAYQKATEALAANKPEGVKATEQFVQANDNNYGAFAALQLAQHYVNQKDYAAAEKQLAQASTLTKDENLLPLIALRQARLQLQQNKLDDALKTLEGVKGASWSAMVQDIRGDVLVRKGDLKGARDAYSKGIDAKASQAQEALLRMKLNNLAS